MTNMYTDELTWRIAAINETKACLDSKNKFMSAVQNISFCDEILSALPRTNSAIFQQNNSETFQITSLDHIMNII